MYEFRRPTFGTCPSFDQAQHIDRLGLVPHDVRVVNNGGHGVALKECPGGKPQELVTWDAERKIREARNAR